MSLLFNPRTASRRLNWEWWYLRYSTTINDALVLSWKNSNSDIFLAGFVSLDGDGDESKQVYDIPLAPPPGKVKTAYVYRVKAPRVGYALQMRPSKEEVFPTLLALVKHQAVQRFFFKADPDRHLNHRELLKAVIPSYSKASKRFTRLNVSMDYWYQGDEIFFRALMKNNRCIERLTLLVPMIPIIAATPPEYPLASLLFRPTDGCPMNKGGPIHLALESWLASTSYCIQKVAIIDFDSSSMETLSLLLEAISHSKTITSVKLRLIVFSVSDVKKLLQQMKDFPKVLLVYSCWAGYVEELKAAVQEFPNIVLRAFRKRNAFAGASLHNQPQEWENKDGRTKEDLM